MPFRARSARRRAACFLLVFALAGSSSCRVISRDISVDRYDVTLSVLPDSSIDVVEAVIGFATSSRAQSIFVRQIPLGQVDDIVGVEATVDGAPATPSSASIRIDRSRGVRVEWRLKASGSPQSLTLRYRLVGAMAAQETHALLRWQALPGNRPYTVAASRININVPHGAAFAAGPLIDDGRTAFVRGDSHAEAELASIATSQPVTITAEIDLRSGLVAEPQWQTNAIRAGRLVPAFISAGICLLVIAFGVVAMVRLQYAPLQKKQTGAVEAEVVSVLRGLRTSGVVAIVFAIAGAVVIVQTMSRFGPWSMAIPAGLFGMGVIFIWVWARWR